MKPRQQNARALTIAELVVRLGRTAHGHVQGLSPAQWDALRYLSIANRFSRTVSAFAEFHATTRGTASQTIKGLVSQGYVSRTPSVNDGRSARLDLTEAGRAVLQHDPCCVLMHAVAALPAHSQTRLERGLQEVLDQAIGEHRARPFGACAACVFLEETSPRRRGRPCHRCGVYETTLADSELEQLCVDFRRCGAARAEGMPTNRAT